MKHLRTDDEHAPARHDVHQSISSFKQNVFPVYAEEGFSLKEAWAAYRTEAQLELLQVCAMHLEHIAAHVCDKCGPIEGMEDSDDEEGEEEDGE